MKITVSLDTQAVISQPTLTRVKAASYVAVEISFTRSSQPVRLPDGATIEFALKPKGQFTGDLLAYHNNFALTAGVHYTGTVNFSSQALLGALGLGDSDPGNDGTQIEASAEITWSVGTQKFRSGTFPVVVEAPLTDDTPVATPDPELYPPPSEVARKSDIPAPPDLTPYALKSELPVVGSAAKLDAGTPDGAATLDGTGKLTGTQVPDSVAQKSDLKPFGSNRIVIANRFSLGSLPSTDANGNQITEVHVADVVNQTGISGTARTALVAFSEHTITDDDLNNGYGVQFYDENGTWAGFSISDFGGSGTTISPADFANAFANAINSYGLNAYANITGDGQVTITGYTTGSLPSDWSFSQDIETATYSITDGSASLPPGDFIVADLGNLGNATGFQAIGDTVDFLSGYGAPTADIGEEGNGYVDQNNGDFYHRDASGWQFVLNIKGPQGAQGTSGKDGKDGTNTARVALGDSTQVGTLLWKCKPPAYTVGTHPQSVCFDGTNIWVANNGSNNVTKLTAATGAVVGTYSVGTAPVGICYDGTYIWVANSGSNNVSKLNASTGAAVGTYSVGTSPQYLCYDGTNIWVTNAGSNNVMRLTASTGAIAGTYATDSNPAGICFDGTNVWVANCNYTTQSLSKFVAATGVLVGTYSYLWNVNSPLGLCFDGTNIWTANSGSFGVAKIVANTAAFVGEYFTDTDPPYWICFDGTYIWATYQAGTIRKLSPTNAAVLGRYKAGSGPRGICFDGTYLWVANYYDNTVSRL
ncbi:MAG: hypothetical protein ACFUZC_16865 [Chthoniobacteraceae bacterium]